jgi:integrase
VPADQRGSVYRTKTGFGIRWYTEDGVRRRRAGFRSRSAARHWFENVEKPRMRGEAVQLPGLTLDDLCERFLAAHAVAAQARTIRTLRQRLQRPRAAFGEVPVRDLERQVAEIAGWRATLPERYRYAVMSAFRQTLAAGVRWGYLNSNPAAAVGPNPPPATVEIEPFTLSEIEAVALELGPSFGALAVFACETALRPSEWAALERRDVDRDEGVVRVERTIVDGQRKPYGKTSLSRRAVPLSSRAVAALDELPAQLGSPLVFVASRGGPIRLDNWRSRFWYPALDAAGVAARGPYAMRHTGITNWLASGIPIYDVSRYAGTSLEMISRVYGHLASGSTRAAVERLDAYRQRLGQESATL